MTDLEKLQHFMAPYYQDASDETLLNSYLTTYTYPECAAAALWNELAGLAGLKNLGVSKIDTGAEKFVFSEPGTVQLACEKQGKYYTKRCNDLQSIGSCAIKVDRSDVAGLTDENKT